jgi:hypothetical protein
MINLTRVEYFTAQAMAALIIKSETHSWSKEQIASWAVDFALCTIRAIEQHNEQPFNPKPPTVENYGLTFGEEPKNK